jgi:hypothetical protein
MKLQLVAAGLAAAFAFTGTVEAQNSSYAEGIYRDFAELHQGAVGFELTVLAKGSVDSLGSRPMSDLTGAPTYTVFVDADSDFRLPKATFADSNLADIYLQDLDFAVDGFAKVGYPLELGDYRLLQVQVNVGKETRTHTAAEFCWQAQGYCVVFDPNIDFLDSEVNSYRTAKADGWGLQIHEETQSIVDGDGSQAKARCGLNSNPANIARWFTRAARTVTYKNLLQIVMVRKDIGAVEAGLRCSSTCRPSPFGYANTSSGFANIPFSLACGNKTNSGILGNQGKFVSKSGCSHRTVLGAKFTATAKGVNLGVDVQIDAVGSVDSSGTDYTDGCGLF